MATGEGGQDAGLPAPKSPDLKPQILGQPVQSEKLGASAESPVPKTPESFNPNIDPAEGAFKTLQSGDGEGFKKYVAAWVDQNPGIPPELLAGAFVAIPDKMGQALQWVQEAKRAERFGGAEGEAIFNRLKQAAERGDQALFDNIRTQSHPKMRGITKALEEDLILGGNREAFLNMIKFDGPHKAREMAQDIARMFQNRNSPGTEGNK